jgi:hypothetical protein
MAASIECLAGLFDGEGSFSIQVGLRSYRPEAPSVYFNPSMSVNLYYGTEVLDEFVASFGGAIYPYSRGGRRWHLGRRVALLAAVPRLQPHLIIKREIAERFTAALGLFPANGSGPDRARGGRVWSAEAALAVAEIALTLNPPRNRRTNKTAEYVEVLRSALMREGRPGWTA